MIKRIKRDFGLVDKGVIATILVAIVFCGSLILWVTLDYERKGGNSISRDNEVIGLLIDTLEVHNNIFIDHKIRIDELEARIEELEGR